MPSISFTFKVTPPPGLTDIRQLPHRWQTATMERMVGEAKRQAELTVTNIKGEWKSYYEQGWGTVPNSLKYQMSASRDGVSIAFRAAGRELQWITSLGGGLFEPGATFFEAPHESQYLSFFWKRFGRWARLPFVGGPNTQRVPWEVDLLSEMFEFQGQEFQAAMGEAYDRAATDLLQSFGTPKPVPPKTRRNF